MLGYDAICPRERVPYDSSGDGATAIGKRRHRTGMVSQIRIASENLLRRRELVVHTNIELVLVLLLGIRTPVVVGRGFSAIGCKNIRQRKSVKTLQCSRIKTVRGNPVTGKGLARETA